MSWFDWVLIGLFAYSALVCVGNVGKPKKPTEPAVAVTVVILDVALIVGILFARGVFA